MASATVSQHRKHFLLLAFPAYGHMTPILELGKKIVPFHDVTFAIQAEKATQLRQRGLFHETAGLHLFPIEDGYQEAVHHSDPGKLYEFVTTSIAKLVANLQRAKPKIPAKENKNSLAPVDVVIADNFMLASLVTPALVEKGIPLYHFNAAGPQTLAMFIMIDEDYPTFPSDDPIPPNFKPLRIGADPEPIPESMKKFFQPVADSLPKAKGVIINSIREIDTEIIEELILKHPRMQGLSFHAVGPLNVIQKVADGEQLLREKLIVQWLDKQTESSIVYVSFGSAASASETQLAEITAALNQLKRPFLWSVPKNQHDLLPAEMKESMRSQFDSSESAYLITEWMPQKAILDHPSTGVFVSHCGWNSTMETLAGGVPVVAWPMFGDQLMDADWFVRNEVGVLVENTGWKTDHVVPSQTIVEKIEEVGGWISGNYKYRDGAKKWKRIFQEAREPNGSSERSLMDLLNT